MILLKALGTKPKSALARSGSKVAPPLKKEVFRDFVGCHIIIHQMPNDQVCDGKRRVKELFTCFIIKIIATKLFVMLTIRVTHNVFVNFQKMAAIEIAFPSPTKLQL